MKRFFAILLALTASCIAFASITGQSELILELNLNDDFFSIEKVGFTKDVPILESAGNLPSALGKIALDANTEKGTIKGSKFYIWWYLYSSSRYSLNCTITPFVGEEGGAQFDLMTTASATNGNEVGLDSKTSAVNALLNYDPQQGVYKGYIEHTIAPFSYVEFPADLYRATVTINLVNTQ